MEKAIKKFIKKKDESVNEFNRRQKYFGPTFPGFSKIERDVEFFTNVVDLAEQINTLSLVKQLTDIEALIAYHNRQLSFLLEDLLYFKKRYYISTTDKISIERDRFIFINTEFKKARRRLKRLLKKR